MQARAAWRHCGNRRHRPSAIARLVSFHLRGRLLHRRSKVRIGDGAVMWADLQFVSTIKAVIGNPPDCSEMRGWRRLLRPGDLFIDVGANAGAYSVLAADLGASVVAVEPNRGPEPDDRRQCRTQWIPDRHRSGRPR